MMCVTGVAIDCAADPWRQVSLVIHRFPRFKAIFVHRRATSAEPQDTVLRDALAMDGLAACCFLVHKGVKKTSP